MVSFCMVQERYGSRLFLATSESDSEESTALRLGGVVNSITFDLSQLPGARNHR